MPCNNSGKKIIYDLGVRKDIASGSKKWQDIVASGAKLDCGPDVAETLLQHGIDLNSITAVIWGYVPHPPHGDSPD